jgi:Tfp pilus assembly protein PilX
MNVRATQNATRQNRTNRQRGVALLFALLTLLVLSVLAAAIIFATQTETWSSLNYQRMLQARYAAEVGAQNTLNWLLYTYTAPTSMSAFDLTQYPVQDGSTHNPIILSAMTGVTANYPDSSVKSAFSYALKDASVPGLGVPASYEVTAKLLSMQPGASMYTGIAGNPQTWEITSQGSVPGVRNAQVQVVMRIQRPGNPIFNYGVVGLGSTCPDVRFSAGTVDSWNSAAGTYASTHQNSGGNIGTNGNVTLSGTLTQVYGTISDSSNINIGGCPGNGITNGVGGTPWNALQVLNQPLVYPNPPAPNPMTPNTNIWAISNTCWSGTGCTVIAGPAIRIAPGSYGNLASNSNIHLSAGIYNFNSLSLSGGSITLDSFPVVINLGGNGVSSGGTLFSSSSSTAINDGGLPANLQIISAAGASLLPPPEIDMNSSSAMYAVVYAPNARVRVTGSSKFLGAVIGEKVTFDNTGGFSYDVALQNNFLQAGPYYLISFSWSKF